MTRYSSNARFWLGLPVAAWLAYCPAPLWADEPAAWVRQALTAVCDDPSADLEAMAERIPGAGALGESPLSAQQPGLGWRRRFELPGGSELRVERFAPSGQLRRVFIEHWTAAPDDGVRPLILLVADGACDFEVGRRLVYGHGEETPSDIEYLDDTLSPTGDREPLNPPVPDGDVPGGVAVAMVDSGVNYLLPEIEHRLARDDNGDILGYDYWDLDRRPFDANPARSPFFPQRHGTRTAALLLREAPRARLVPYRYPRPDMARMAGLIDDAASHGVRLFNMSLGSDNRQDWDAFAAAAARHPHALFVLSAGNNGRDIDTQPVYPASLSLDNVLTVTSAENDGRLAPGSNWGAQTVDLMVPAERLVTTGFDGGEEIVSGSSYAAVRITALAARMLAEHTDWQARDLKQAIVARALPDFSGDDNDVNGGFVPRPDKAERLPPVNEDGAVRIAERQVLGVGDLYDNPVPPVTNHALSLSLAYFGDTEWRVGDLQAHARESASTLAQCAITLIKVTLYRLDGPRVYRYFHDIIGTALVQRTALPKPTIYFVRDTLQADPYDAESIGAANSATRPALRDTIWITETTPDPGIALAHEVTHLLMNDGGHVETAGNLMRARTSPSNKNLTDDQCEAMVRKGTANGLLVPEADPESTPVTDD